MKLVFTKKEVFRKGDLITWGLEEPVSHVGMLFDNGMALHSSFFGGVMIQTKEQFFKNRVGVLAVDLIGHDDATIFRMAEEKLNKKEWDYDFLYAAYLACEALGLKLFNKRISNAVSFESMNDIICHEILEFVGLRSTMFDQEGANTPYRMFLKLKSEGFKCYSL